MKRKRVSWCLAVATWVAVAFSFSASPGLTDVFAKQTQTRLAAEALATWGVENNADLALLSGLSGLLAAGVSLDPEDPWKAHFYKQILQEKASTNAQIQRSLSQQLAMPRGVVDGITRIDAVIEPGESLTVVLKMAQKETALVEARIKGDGHTAEIDLVVTSLSGDVLASDIGPATGVAGTGTWAQWFSETCETVEINVTNTGEIAARVVMMAPPSQQNDCESE